MTKKTSTSTNGTPAKPRRDPTGHLDPAYASDLREKSGAKPGEPDAFLHRARSKDSLAEMLGEDAITAATSGGADAGEALDAETPEEHGGPFVTTSGASELSAGTDSSNPLGATREPFPRT